MVTLHGTALGKSIFPPSILQVIQFFVEDIFNKGTNIHTEETL